MVPQTVIVARRVRHAPRLAMRARQRGQVVILVAVTTIILLLAALLVYNVGRLNLAKTKLQNTADSAAYSGAVLLARTYNYASYTNRAMVANQVAIAQMVSLASWSRYYCLTFTKAKCGKFAGTGTDDVIIAALELISGGEPGITSNSVYAGISKGVFQVFDKAIPPIIKGLNALEALLSDASRIYYDGVLAQLASDSIGVGPMSKVVHDNDPDASISHFGMAWLGTHMPGIEKFIKLYKPVKQPSSKRFHNVVMASRDDWTKARSGPELPPFTSLLWSAGECFGDGVGFIIETGGWRGSTTLSSDNKSWSANDEGIFAGAGVCVIFVDIGPIVIPVPIPLIVPNPPSYGVASTGKPEDAEFNIKKYSGLRNYLGVSDLGSPDMQSPTITIFVQRHKEDVNTTHQMHARGEDIAGGQLDMDDSESGGTIQAGSSAEAYFARPDNALTLGGYTVYGNLFNPYWEAHLVETPDTTVIAANVAQETGL